MSAVNQQTNYYYGPNFESYWFKPVRLCHRQWKNLTSPIERHRSVLGESIKRILLAIPLALATLIACLVAIPGFLRLGVTITTSSNIGNTNIEGSNQEASRTVDLNAAILRGVELRSMGNVVIHYTEQEQYLEMTADDNLLGYLTHHEDGQNLILNLQEGVSISTRNPIFYHLYIPHMALNRLVVSGSGSMHVDRLETDEFSCRISGQARITINNGHATRQNIVISGQGRYHAPNFQVENSHIVISGQGNARVHTNQSLNVQISGTGSCIYSGTPRQIQQQISGMGSLAPA